MGYGRKLCLESETWHLHRRKRAMIQSAILNKFTCMVEKMMRQRRDGRWKEEAKQL